MSITNDYEIGLLYRSAFRNILKEEKFKGVEVEWLEQKGFLSSKFIIRASPEFLWSIDAMLYKIIKEK